MASSPHPQNALTALRVKSLSKPGRYADGNGLYLIVDPSGAKRWMLRTVVRGRRRDIGLGGVRLVSLAEARINAAQLRAIARDGGDPLEARRKARAVVPKFREAATRVHADNIAGWKNEKHAAQWLKTLDEYAFPYFGEAAIDTIGTPDVLKALGAIWLQKPETARRVKQRIGMVFDWAKAAGHVGGENPVAGVSKGLPRQPDSQKHHAAMGYAAVPAFVERLQRDTESDQQASALALEFLILTATRTNETLHAKWSEIDEAAGVWTIPAARMKAGREHRVPLALRALEVLKAARALWPESDYVFPGAIEGKPLSNMALLMRMRRMGEEATVHGFRSAFRDWAAERTNFPREVCEMALAHTIKDKSEAAYRRGDLLERRRALMKAWAAHLAAGLAKVVAIRA